jgi:hypothetical protein
MTCALRTSDSRCELSCGVPKSEHEFYFYCKRAMCARTASVDNVSGHVLRSDFWRNGDLWHDMLDLSVVQTSSNDTARSNGNAHVEQKTP